MKYELVTSSEILDIRDGTHDSPKYKNQGFPLITSKNLKQGSICFEDVNFISERDFLQINKRSKVDLGDILYSMIGSIGNYALVNEPPKFAIKNVALFKFNNPDIYNKYFYYLLNSSLIINQIQEQQRGGTQKFITLKILRNLKIPLPPIKTQQKIAAILDEADKLRRLDKRLIKKYEHLSQSLFLELFGDPVNNPKGWDYLKVEDIATIVRGSSPRPKGDPRYYGKGVPRLMVADLTRDGLYVTPKIDSLTYEGATKSRFMEKGDIVMAVSGKPGLPAILEVDCCIHDGFAGFRNVSDEYHKVFLYYYFRNYIREVNKKSVGAIFKNITTSDIREIKVPVVSKKLQNQFVKTIEKIAYQKSLAMESRNQSNNLFNSLLQKAFKGELVKE